jgi:CheY-like chemotaxis protein
MNGKIKVKSTCGNGTEFELYIPAVIRGTASIMNPLKQKNNKKLSGSVIIVDDEEDVRDVLKIKLESLGLSVIAVDEGSKAIAELEKNKFDLLITDLQMPKMSGIQLIDEISSRGFDVKIMVITGGTFADCTQEENDKMNARVYDFITKPFSKNDLFGKLKDFSVIQ